jgi:hypothetical protein
MPKKLFKNYSLLIIIILFSANVCAAQGTINLINPENGAQNIPLFGSELCYFKWGEVSGAVKYYLDIDPLSTQTEDNITSLWCSAGECSFGFLQLSIGSLSYNTTYSWHITAFDISGNPIAYSPEYSFTTEQAPEPPSPPPDGNGGDEGTPIDLLNPFNAGSLAEAIDALMNILFLLAFAIGPILIIYAAFLLLFSGGNTASVNKAKAIIFWTLIALTVILFAKGLPAAIKGMLGT